MSKRLRRQASSLRIRTRRAPAVADLRLASKLSSNGKQKGLAMRGHFHCGDVGGLLTGAGEGLEPKGLVGELGLVEPGEPLAGGPVVPLGPGPFRPPAPAPAPPARLTELIRSSTGS